MAAEEHVVGDGLMDYKNCCMEHYFTVVVPELCVKHIFSKIEPESIRIE